MQTIRDKEKHDTNLKYILFFDPRWIQPNLVHQKANTNINQTYWAMNNTSTSNGQLSMVVIPQAVWEQLVSDIQDIKSGLQSGTSGNFSDEWIESETARKMLGICQKTWQTYRDRRLIPFAQIGRKIYVRRSDLNAFMEKNYITGNDGKEVSA